MSIDRPRRIFRSSTRSALSRGLLRTLGVGAAGAVLGAVIVLAEMPSPAQLVSAAPGQVAVIDGDTLRLGSTIVHLSDVQAPERGQACAAGPDCGGRASAALAELVRNRPVECRVRGRDGLGRPAGRCDAGGQDVNLALVATGWARANSPIVSAAFSAAETEARSHRRGMWLAN